MAEGSAERAWTYGQYVEHYEQLEAEVKRLEKAIRIARIKLGVIEIRAQDRRPIGGKGDKPIWITAKNGLKQIEQALKGGG